MVTLNEVVDLVRREMRGKAPAEMAADTRLEDLSLSSLQVAEIVYTLEEEHEVEFDESRAAEIKTLGDVVALANAAIASASAPADAEAV
ncbi:MAG TPA: phosphopantetheine-binding protein [Solirubrobacterales bacterium]